MPRILSPLLPYSAEHLTPSAMTLALFSAFSVMPVAVWANPTGGVAIVGQASMVSSGNQLLVTTQNGAGTNYSAINWQSFSIPAGSTTRIEQPSAASMSINRVVTNTPSLLFGTLSSNGKVVLVNQAGIAVGAGALVDTAGFTASAVGMSDADATSGRLRFTGDGMGNTSGALTVQGTIIARGGDVVLIAPSIELAQTAVVESLGGSVILAAGQSVEITGRGLEGITLQVQAPTDQALNLGTLKGDAVGIFAGTLKHSGLIQAVTASLEGGRVVLKATGDAYVDGNARIEATGVTGGQVDVLGKRVAVMDQATIDASGQFGGGTIRVGGDYQGKNADVPNAKMAYFGKDATLKVNAIESGNGGKVIVWSDDATRAYGSIEAKGGSRGGDGGFVETSGKGFLAFEGNVDTSAQHGNKGTLLLDPTNIYIAVDQATATTAGMAGADVTVDATGPTTFQVNTPTDSLLTTATLNAAIANNNVTINTSGGGAGNGDIVVASNVTKSSGATTTLKLIANRDVVMKNSVNITSTSGALNVVLNSDSDATGGGSIVMNSGSFITSNGGDVSLGGGASVAGNAVGNTTSGGFGISLNNATINAGVGSITMRGIGSATGGAYGVSIAGGSISSTTGAINITGTGGTSTVGNNVGVVLSGGASLTTTSGNLAITGTGAGTGDTNEGIRVTGASITSTSGAINLTGTGAGGASIGSAGVLLGGANTVSVTSSGSSAIQVSGTGSGLGQGVTLDSTLASVTLGGSSHTGDLTIIAGGVGVNKDFSISGTDAIVSGTGNLYIKPINAATTIGVGSGAGDFNLSAAEIARIADGFSRITIGSSSQTGDITVGTSTFTDNVKFETSSGAIINDGTLTSTGNTVSLATTSGAINNSTGGINAGALDVVTQFVVSLTGTNTVSSFSASKTSGTEQISFWNTGNLSLGAVTTPGNLQIKTGNGALTQTAPLSVTGATTLEAGTGNIDLSNTSNDFSSITLTSAGAVNIKDANALTLNSIAATTSLNVYSVGNLTLGANNFSVSGTGDAMVLRTDGTFAHNGSTQLLSAPNGRWLIYLKNPGGHTFQTIPAFKQYNAAYGDTVLGTGNGVLYNNTTPAVLTLAGGVDALTGGVTKAYDGSLSMSVATATYGTIAGGLIDGDTVSNPNTVSGGTGLLSDVNVGTGKLVTVKNVTVGTITGGNGIGTVYGYRVKGSVGTVTAASSSTSSFPGDVVTAFAEKFEAVLTDPQNVKDEKREKTKDALVVEAEICRP